jgi:ABC-2 type transport system ATP-binding protein
MSIENIVTCSNLTKDYGGGTGLFDLNLKIRKGEVFGLVGPNGAGKSTFIKLLMDIVRPTRGEASIFGLDSRKDSLELKKRIGYLPGELMQFPSVTAGYILNLLSNLRGMSEKTSINTYAERLQLDLNRKYQDLSHGNKQKVGLIQALMHSPDLVILDEPTLGLDPIVQREVKLIIKELIALGKTIVLSSHIMSEVETVCNRIGFINHGKVLREGTLSELRQTRVHKVTVLFNSEIPTADELRNSGAESIEVYGKSINLQMRGSVDRVMKLLSKYTIEEFDSRELSLEEVFFSEVER